MRVVLDTNILLSALISATGAPAQLLDAWRERRFLLVSSVEQIDEFRAVSRHPRLRDWIHRGEAGRFVKQLGLDALVLEELPSIERAIDPTDNFLLGMAQAGSVDYLVCGDRRGVLALESHGSTRILTARDMLRVPGIRRRRRIRPVRRGIPRR